MLKIYGSRLCPDCVACLADLDRAEVPYEYLDFGENLQNLKDFLALRDSLPIFKEVKENRKIGIPCILREDGSVALEWGPYVSQDET
ncbi:MAG: hypothetical protein ACI4PO_01920 [Faecousia sp.]